MKNPNYSIGNRTRDLQACSVEPQQNVQLRYLTVTLSHCHASVFHLNTTFVVKINL
jgi:hypothetical protein